MRIRAGFVSNSSSSSCVIWNWGELPEEKKRMVLNYQEAVQDYWRSKGYAVVNDGGFINPSVDDMVTDGPDDFGSVESTPAWRMEEKCHGQALYLSTIIDNFDMLKWLRHIGGIEYQYTGEC